MGQGCWESGGPEWLFEFALGAGAVAITYGLVWILLLVLEGKPAPKREPRSFWRRSSSWYLLLLAFLTVSLVPQIIEDPVRALSAFALTAPAVATLYVVVRRARGTGVMPPARSAPLGMFWVLGVVSVVGLLASVAAFVATFELGYSIPC